MAKMIAATRGDQADATEEVLLSDEEEEGSPSKMDTRGEEKMGRRYEEICSPKEPDREVEWIVAEADR